ncbi:MAG: ATP-binding protein [Caulobacterales bacterium]
MTDQIQHRTPRGGQLDLLQVLFWSSLAVGVMAAGVAITAGPSVGRIGAILLILLAVVGMVLFMWLSRGAGRKFGAFPERGVIEAHALGGGRSEFVVLDAIDEPALITDANLSPISANHAYIELAEEAGALGESDRPPAMSRLFGADPMLSAPMFRLSRAAQSGQGRREELPPTALRRGGEPVLYEACVGPMPNGRVLWRLREVLAARSSAEDDESRDIFLDEAPVGFFAARSDGQVTYMNRALRAVLGVGDDPARLRIKDFVKEDAARLARRDRRGFGPTRVSITLRARDGVESPAAAISFWSGPERNGALRAFVFFSEQEAPQTTAGAVLASPREREATDGVFEHAPFGAAVLDGADPAAATILDANPALMEMTEGRAAPGAAFADIFDASEGPAELALRLRRAGGQPLEFQLATNPPTAAHVQFASGPDGKGVAYVVNVTEQRELEQRLAQSEKMREIGMLAGGVAHDFNNLLMVVMQNCDYLLRRHPVGDPDFLDLQEINAHALRAKELSEMLRAYARQQTFKREVFNPSDFVANVQELIRRLLGAALKFEIKHGRDLPLVKADMSQLERVLINLAANARDAMTPPGGEIPRDGRLTLRTARVNAEDARAFGYNPIEDGEYCLIEIEDTGQGIKPEDAAKIFRPFHSTKGEGKGTGLGLATSYGIIKQSGGYIFFSSTPGKGTTFRIYLPAHEPTAAEVAEIQRKELAAIHRPVTDVAGRGRILLVEDQAGVRKAIARNLVECGFDVLQAEDGEEALGKLTEEPGAFDLIISDVSMPIMTGPEMLREAGPHMIGKAKVLFLSGYAPESFEHTLQEFPVSYMSKPVGMPQLAARVKDLLAQAS